MAPIFDIGPPPDLHFPKPAIIRPGDPDFIHPDEAKIMGMVARRKQASAVAITYQSTGDTGAFSTGASTLSSLTLGASGSKAIIVAVGMVDVTGLAAITGVSVDGEATTVQLQTDRSGNYRNEIWVVDGITATSGDVVLTTDSGGNSMVAAVWSMTGHGSITPTDTDSDVSGATPLTDNGDFDVQANGAVAAFAFHNVASRTYTWTGPTEDVDTGFTNGSYTAASADYASAQENLSVEALISGAANANGILTMAAWGP